MPGVHVLGRLCSSSSILVPAAPVLTSLGKVSPARHHTPDTNRHHHQHPALTVTRVQGEHSRHAAQPPALCIANSSVIVMITGHCPMMSHAPCPMPGPGLTPQFKCSAAAAQLSYFPRGRALLGWARAALQPSSQTGSGDRRRATAASPEHGGSGADSAQPGYQQPFLPPDMAPCGYNCI